jgi:hypothetical protein
MLSDEEKSRIREEEIYRAEVRKQLKASSASTSGQRLLKAANTPLALWFLSSILLPVSRLFIRYTNETRRRSRRRPRSSERSPLR